MPAALRTGAKIATDVADGRSFREAAKARVTERINEAVPGLIPELGINEADLGLIPQSGSGFQCNRGKPSRSWKRANKDIFG